MSIKTKVKSSGEFFHAMTNTGPRKTLELDAFSPLEPGAFYAGHLFPESIVGSSHYVEFSEATFAIFSGSDLEEFSADTLLVRF